MSDTTATPTWPPQAPAPDAGATARIHLAVPGIRGSHAATMTREPRPDGSQVVRLDRAGQLTRLVIPAGESFADAWRRIEAAITQVTYPSGDQTSESSVSHTPAGMHGQ